jgi:N-acetylglucosaminyl-diphospho-decaprenol L-rhamnosyltransferase
VHDLAIVIPSLDDGAWLERCLPTVLDRVGDLDVDVVISDIGSTDHTAEVAERFGVRSVRCENRGFAHANNVALVTCDARYALLLNADTEIVDGTFGELVAALDARPDVGAAGVRQLDANGDVYPTMRRFLSARRLLLEAVGSETLAPSRVHRVLDRAAYDRETSCDWTIGSFLILRREALLATGLLDERYFFYAEEEDLCLRVRQAGWDVRHLPAMTIVHHVGKGGLRPRFEAQKAYARRQYAAKHFSPPRRLALGTAQLLADGLRALPIGAGDQAELRRRCAIASLRVTVGRDAPPFGPPGAGVPVLRGDA